VGGGEKKPGEDGTFSGKDRGNGEKEIPGGKYSGIGL